MACSPPEKMSRQTRSACSLRAGSAGGGVATTRRSSLSSGSSSASAAPRSAPRSALAPHAALALRALAACASHAGFVDKVLPTLAAADAGLGRFVEIAGEADADLAASAIHLLLRLATRATAAREGDGGARIGRDAAAARASVVGAVARALASPVDDARVRDAALDAAALLCAPEAEFADAASASTAARRKAKKAAAARARFGLGGGDDGEPRASSLSRALFSSGDDQKLRPRISLSAPPPFAQASPRGAICPRPSARGAAPRATTSSGGGARARSRSSKNPASSARSSRSPTRPTARASGARRRASRRARSSRCSTRTRSGPTRSASTSGWRSRRRPPAP